MKKRSIVLLVATALIMATLSGFMLTASAASATPELSIPFCNLSFRDSVCIKYAVKSNVADVKLLIWTEPQEAYTVGTHDDEITEYYTENIGGVQHMIFDYTALNAKQMTDVVYVRAYAQAGGTDHYSDVNKYSILQYAYNKLGKTATASSDEDLKEMLTYMLAYGAAAQKYLDNYKIDRLATADWYQVKLTAGVLDDGCTHGLYLPGDQVTLIAPATDASGAAFSHWADSNGNSIGATATYTLTVGNANEVYTPVYGTAEEPPITGPTITIGKGSGAAGEEVTIQVEMANSPKLYTLALDLSFDETALSLVSATSGEAMSAQTYVQPSRLKDGCKFLWYANDPTDSNGAVLTLVFKVNEGAAIGNYPITLTCDADNTFDEQDNFVEYTFVQGSIEVK